MSKFWDKFSESLLTLIISAIIGILTGCLLVIWGNLRDPLRKVATQVIYQDTNKTIILMTLIAMALLICILSALSYSFYKKQKNKLKPYFGILWNHKGNGYCSACQIPLSLSTTEKAESCLYYCSKCNKKFPLYGNQGFVMNIIKVKQFIVKPTNKNRKKYIDSQYPHYGEQII